MVQWNCHIFYPPKVPLKLYAVFFFFTLLPQLYFITNVFDHIWLYAWGCCCKSVCLHLTEVFKVRGRPQHRSFCTISEESKWKWFALSFTPGIAYDYCYWFIQNLCHYLSFFSSSLNLWVPTQPIDQFEVFCQQWWSMGECLRGNEGIWSYNTEWPLAFRFKM